MTIRILNFNVKKVMVDQESGAEVMYPDLYWGLGFMQRDLSKHDTPLVAFDGMVVTLMG